MKTFACCAALLAFALSAPAQADTINAYTNNFDDPVTVAAGVNATLTGWDYVVDTGGNSYAGWDGRRLFNFGSAGTASIFTLSNLPAHTAVSASFVLGFLGSWDSLDGTDGLAPDYLDIFIDDVHVAQLTYNNVSGTVKQIGGGTLLAEYDPSFAGTAFPQTVVDMSTASFLTFGHTASTLKLSIAAGGAGFTGGSDEEWGLDSLSINLTTGVPEPGAWALMIMGFGAAGARLRRRRAAVA